MTEREFAEEVRTFGLVVSDMTKAMTDDLDEHGRFCGVTRACGEYVHAVNTRGMEPVERLEQVEQMFRARSELGEFYDGLVDMTDILIRLHDKVVTVE